MANGDFWAFSGNGAYNMNLASQQMNAQNQSLGNIYGATNYGGMLGGLQAMTSTNSTVSSLTLGELTQYFYPKPAPEPQKIAQKMSPWREKFNKKFPPTSEFKSFLQKLQYEIESWHGDVLERCPA